ncbi:glycosyltransferase family 2 protein [Halanaerobium sp. Z-7514]|uniref:Glycosyltransferase family 2 protein n=1 Tax=Halanaerobium polyolivorans TaxID=2886943 RepID=A0AAW4X1G4_9FIRM|nr:glycosyltransferase family 2 protein [Halanaerobium polyolivorans]MCC3145661.1 glycosyltransferase family 2 protein [Halanaerobium polyolivorans]
MFTFLTISYNQQDYIIEHLESIKYQIINHKPNNEKIEFILSDDASTDNTVLFAEKWLDKHNYLFDEIKIRVSDKNKGINNNFLEGLNLISGDKFKYLAADDLYFIYNIFNVINNNDVVFSTTIKFSKDKLKDLNEINDFTSFIKHYFLLKYKSINFFKLFLKSGKSFSGPGAFYNLDMMDENIKKFIYKYTWIEDRPIWDYLFSNYPNLNFKATLRPHILYRIDDGISKDNNEKNKDYIKDKIKYFKENTLFYNFPKYLNPLNYFWKLIYYKSLKIDMSNSKIMDFNNNLEQDLNKATEYIKYIEKSALEFFNSNIKNNEEVNCV